MTARLIEHNAHGVRLYWTGSEWLLETPEGRQSLGDLPAENAISMFDRATREAARRMA